MNSRVVDYRFELLNRYNMTIGTVNASGKINYNDSAEIKKVASFNINESKDIDFLNDRIRPIMRLDKVDYPLGIYLMNSPSRKSTGSRVLRDVEAYDQTVILRDDRFGERYRVASGTPYTNAIITILDSAGITNYRVTASSLTLRADMEFEPGTSKLKAVNTLLAGINYNDIYVDNTGSFVATPYIAPEARTVEKRYLTDKDSIVLVGATETLDIFSAPNKFVRYVENANSSYLISTAVNDDPKSILSTVSRGRTITDVVAINDIADQATLDAYVQRLVSESKIYQTVTFTSLNIPTHEALTCLYISNDELGISGKYIENGWTMDLKVGGTMSHTCRKAVDL